MDANPKKIAVIGQGVMGLTSASRLLDSGYDVHIFSKETFENTTSMAAGAYWWPHKLYPEKRVTRWAKETLDVFTTSSKTPASGIHFEPHFRFCLDPDDGGYARHLVEECETINGEDYGIPCHEAYRLKVPVVDVPTFMPFLRKSVLSAGAQIMIKALTSPNQLFPAYDLVVNCTGVWAHHFVNDSSVFPIRGQAVRISLPEGMRTSTRIFQKDDKFTLILPRSNDIILGGTAQEGNWSKEPDPEDTRVIISRCNAIVPEITHCEVLGESVGLRPGRTEVRLELEMPAPGCPVVHNYGHGGGGYTVSWGCANEVTELVNQYFNS